jgi:hypothetical protein
VTAPPASELPSIAVLPFTNMSGDPEQDYFADGLVEDILTTTEMQVKLTEGEQSRLHYTTTTNVEAWTHWVEGLAHYRRSVAKQDLATALACWKRALALDSASAPLKRNDRVHSLCRCALRVVGHQANSPRDGPGLYRPGARARS